MKKEQDKTNKQVYGAMVRDVTLYVLVIRMAGRKWELLKLFRTRCYILPCFHSPYGTYNTIVELSVGTSNKTSFKMRHVEPLRLYSTLTLCVRQVWVKL